MKDSNKNSASNEEHNPQDPSRQFFSSSFSQQSTHQNPEITLPKGGGALKGIDEKFQVNPVNNSPCNFSINRNITQFQLY